MGEEAVRNANLLELLNICRDNGLTWTDTLAVSTAAPFTYTSDTPLAYEKEGGGVAGGVGAGGHGDAAVGVLEGQHVVDAVAGHGHDIAPALPGVDDADLMLRGYPGVDRNVGQALVQLSVSHAVQLHAGHRLVPVPEDAELPGDGGGGHLVIAGNHDGADAAPLGVGHGLDGLGPGRVDHGDEANEAALSLVQALRIQGFKAERDYLGRKLKAQFKSADVFAAKALITLGSSEVESGQVTVKNNQTRQEVTVALESLKKDFPSVLAELGLA